MRFCFRVILFSRVPGEAIGFTPWAAGTLDMHESMHVSVCSPSIGVGSHPYGIFFFFFLLFFLLLLLNYKDYQLSHSFPFWPYAEHNWKRSQRQLTCV